MANTKSRSVPSPSPSQAVKKAATPRTPSSSDPSTTLATPAPPDHDAPPPSPEPGSPHYSTRRVIRDGILVYAEGDVIPTTDPEELLDQGLITKKEASALTKNNEQT